MSYSKRTVRSGRVGPHLFLSIPYGDVVMLSDDVAAAWDGLGESGLTLDDVRDALAHAGPAHDAERARAVLRRLIETALLVQE